MLNILNLFKANINLSLYKFNHWFFQWKQDEDGGIAFVICNRLAFVKYKEHTIIRFDANKMKMAERHQGYRGE